MANFLLEAHVSIFPPASLMCCYCLQDYDSFEKLRLKDGCISHLLPVCYQDMIVRVYTRKPELVSEMQPNPTPLFSSKLPASCHERTSKPPFLLEFKEYMSIVYAFVILVTSYR